MSEILRPGKRGEPLPVGEIVLRLVKTSKDGEVLEMAFELTTRDKVSPAISLSLGGATDYPRTGARVYG
jgi:hypothetical protein